MVGLALCYGLLGFRAGGRSLLAPTVRVTVTDTDTVASHLLFSPLPRTERTKGVLTIVI